MGSAIAQRLASLGHEMMVWNRTADKARSLGFPVAATPGELAQRSEIVISILTDAKAVDQVYEDMLKGDVKGKLFVEMSTVRPQVQKDLNKR
jgi:3-hydroxyisobutyrate dehydrogenase